MGDRIDEWAKQLAEAELSGPLPRRWAHTRGVAERAVEVRQVLGIEASLLIAAATLHDVGYAPRLAVTGFHPLDGARFLRDEHGADERLVRLVANHSFALLEAEERGLREVLAREFPLLEEPLLVDALVYCDMTTTPDGAGPPLRSVSRRSVVVTGMTARSGGSSVGRCRRSSPPSGGWRPS